MLTLIRPLIEITRPLNNLILAGAILVAMILTHHFSLNRATILAILSAVLIAAGGNTLNDVNDLEIDRVNKPGRPLPVGKISVKQALVWSTLLFCGGWFLAGQINSACLVMAVFASILLIFYDCRYKKRPIVGNLVVSLLTACAFLYGGLAVGRIDETVIPAVFSFFFHLGREIIKDVEDMAGDGLAQAETLPLLWGKKAALVLATMIYGLVIVITILPYVCEIYSQRYLILVMGGVHAVLIILLTWMWLKPDTPRISWVSRILKYDMIMGLIALYFR